MNTLENEFLPIADYGLIGNCKTAALVSKYGSIDWCCFPNFDSESVFAKILDPKRGGFFSISPPSEFTSAQRYASETNTLVTTFHTESGIVELWDTFSVSSEPQNKRRLEPHHEILRSVRGVSGRVKMRLTYAPQPGFGKDQVSFEKRAHFGVLVNYGDELLILRSDLDDHAFEIDTGSSGQEEVRADFLLRAQEVISFSLSYSDEAPAVFPPMGVYAQERLKETESYWSTWASRCQYQGIYEEHVRRSILTLKLMTFAPSGAVIAAPTTSLPEAIGGNRNWDYRYCWLRDAAFTTRAFVKLGYIEEAKAYVSWLLHATRLTWPKLQVVYSIYGDPELKETTLPGWRGYKNSAPVRIGNEAHAQFQLDVYGEVIDALYALSPHLEKLDHDTKSFLRGLATAVLALWDEPDDGIWEVRSGRVQHTHSKVLAWVALDRLKKLGATFRIALPFDEMERVCERLGDQIETQGFNEALQSYVRVFGGDELDASLLVMPLVGYCEASSPRVLSTCRQICEKLSKNGLLYRYGTRTHDGFPPGEGSFGICNFWLTESLAKAGQLNEAKSWFEALVKKANPLGLWSEEMDPESNEFLGNYPQAFSHIGLINAVMTLSEEMKKKDQAVQPARRGA